MVEAILEKFGLVGNLSGVYSNGWVQSPGGRLVESINPSDGKALARVMTASESDYQAMVANAQAAFGKWSRVPAPVRAQMIRQFGEALRFHKKDLGLLITLETGKILAEGEGEVQEMIDMCDFAVGLSRQLSGVTLSSERPNHRMFEQWHPLGVVGIISAFNFPAAVWAWNSLLAAITGNTMIWKPSARTPLTSIAVHKILEPILLEHQTQGVFHLCVTEGHLGANWMARDVRIPMVSATGSSQMGREVGSLVAQRLGKTLLELGGNNAAILTPSANCGLALRAVVFAAVGTAGQRCTTLRRLFVHRSMEKEFVEKLVGAYRSIRIGNPWESDTLMGPLISEQAVTNMLQAIDLAKSQGAKLLHGGKQLDRAGYFVEPAIFKADPSMDVVARETFAPILYVMPYENLRDAIRYQNAVSQGLSSAIFTEQLTEMEEFLSASGSDCGIANVNMGTSGAEIGGSFGGEKESGGGREAGADSWKNYMRRQTCTINYGKDLPLSQGVRFDL